MSGRDQILGKIRTALGRDGMDAGLRADMETRLSQPQPNLIPTRGDGDEKTRTTTFIAEATRIDADVVRVATLTDVPAAAAAYGAGKGLTTAQPTALLKSIPWQTAPTLAVNFGTADGTVAVGISEAYAGVAETGTLVLRSTSDQAMSANVLPDTHIVVLPAGRILRAYEDVWAALRKKGADFMPRSLVWITGPSRTADIEQTLLLGAHGPRRLLIVIVDEETDPQ